MTSFSTRITAAALGAVGLALGAATTDPASAQDLTALNIMTSNNTSCSNFPQFVGQDLGIAADQGISWTLLNSETTIPFVAFLDTKDAEFVMLDSAQVLQMANAKQPSSVVYEVFTFAAEGIFVPADSEIRTLADLKGATVGLASDRDQITTIITMDSIGETIESMEIETVVVGDVGPVLASSLQDGTIKALAGSTTDMGNIEAAGLEIRNLTPPEVSRNPGNNWVMSNERMEEGFAVPFLRTWSMSQLAGAIDEQVIIAICKDNVPERFEVQEIGEQAVRFQLYLYQLQRSVKRGELRPWVWESIQGPYIKFGEIPGPIDVSTFLDDRFIDEANDYTTREVVDYVAAWREANPDLLAQ